MAKDVHAVILARMLINAKNPVLINISEVLQKIQKVMNLHRKFKPIEDDDGGIDDEEIIEALGGSRVLPVPCGSDIACNHQCEECMIPGRRYTLKELTEHDRHKLLSEQEMLDEIDAYGITPGEYPTPNWVWS